MDKINHKTIEFDLVLFNIPESQKAIFADERQNHNQRVYVDFEKERSVFLKVGE